MRHRDPAMLKRTARLRREYMYRKSLEGKERQSYERKRTVRLALAEGKPIPNELRGDERELRKEADLEDARTAIPTNHVDDEYGGPTTLNRALTQVPSRAFLHDVATKFAWPSKGWDPYTLNPKP